MTHYLTIHAFSTYNKNIKTAPQNTIFRHASRQVFKIHRKYSDFFYFFTVFDLKKREDVV